jgi:hypothetical protein
MMLAIAEFIRRFLIHALRKGFHRIRHYACSPNTLMPTTSARARQGLALSQVQDEIVICRQC